MKIFLSFGGGVNSVAMYLLLKDQGVDFEGIFVDHGTDWPETYEYVDMFINKGNPITILKPLSSGYDNLFKLCWDRRIVPSFMFRWCTEKFKIRPIKKYIDKPCFMMLGIDHGEIKRAKLSSIGGVENRFPLIENEINRSGCKKIIKDHYLPIPMKSGCFICPYQRRSQWKQLRRVHPDLFCKAEQLEKRNMEYRVEVGKKPLFLCQSPKMSLKNIVDERQSKLWVEDEYPPCECML